MPLESPERPLEDESLQELDRLTLREILDNDSRPTFVIDLVPDNPTRQRDTSQPVFCNAALRQHDQLLDSVTGATELNVTNKGLGGTTTFTEFCAWATGISASNESRDVFLLTLHYQGLLWTGFTIRQRWRIISGNALFQTSDIPKDNLQGDPSTYLNFEPSKNESKLPNPIKDLASAATTTIPTSDILPAFALQSEYVSESSSKNTSKDISGIGSVTLATPDNAVPDWTVPNPPGIMSEHVAFTRTVDWASTPLGPMDKWSVQFRETVNLLMRNPHPASLFWGEELTMLYNEAYRIEVVGNKHPARAYNSCMCINIY
jgi:hypothetical protein